MKVLPCNGMTKYNVNSANKSKHILAEVELYKRNGQAEELWGHSLGHRMNHEIGVQLDKTRKK